MICKRLIIEGMHKISKKEYILDGNTYLVGGNGSGKTTVLKGIQLALLGYIPGEGKKGEDIFRHSNSHTMAVTLYLDDEGTQIKISRMWTRIRGSVTCTTEIVPDSYTSASIVSDLEFPVFNFSELLALTANKQKDWFIDFLPRSESELDWETILSKEGLEIADDIRGELIADLSAKNLSGVDGLKVATEYLKDKLSYFKARYNADQGSISSLVYFDDVPTGVDEAAITAEMSDLRQKLTEAIQYETLKSRLVSVQAALDAIDLPEDDAKSDARYAVYDAQIAECRQNGDTWSKILEEDLALLKQLEQEAAPLHSAISKGSVCPYTEESCEAIAVKLAGMTSKASELDAQIHEVQAQIVGLRNSIKETEMKHREAAAAQQALVNKYEERDQLRRQLCELPEYAPVCTSEECEAKIAALNDQLVKVRANQNYINLIDKITASVFRLKNAIAAITSWIKITDANGKQTELMEAPFADATNAISSILSNAFGEPTVAHFNLAQKANSFSFGILRGEQYIPYDLLSSGEKCVYLISLLIYVIEASAAPLKLLVVDDLFDHLDKSHCEMLCKALSNIEDVQFIFAGVCPDINGFCNIINVEA